MRISARIVDHPIVTTSKEAFLAAKEDHDAWMNSAVRLVWLTLEGATR